ncbi:MFS transporter [Pedobacter sp. SYP-B3415]|uniref:MFS transporter n=1 Tax=Pedobacter sp. SYP-B3415 TaxID=2496641 RepID=UPI00101D6E47|nr:MFS transporter [Pedobacter sp. SYP-B3415]
MSSLPITLNKKQEYAYAAGMMGWSIMSNLIIVMLPYFYLPPNNAGLPVLVPQLLFFGIFNVLSLIAASGRLVDALYDPFIAAVSDRSTNPRGRRIPIMRWAIVPSVVCCCLVFTPPHAAASTGNAWWLVILLCLFFVSVTSYIIPYNALLAELAHTQPQKVRLSTFQQVGFVVGIIISALVNNFADLVQDVFAVPERARAVQFTIWSLATLAGAAMLLPILSIDERKFTRGQSAHIPFFRAIKSTFRNSNFKYYLISDFAYYTALSIISSGLLYFVTVLLGLPEAEGGKFMAIMVLSSLLFYPLINYGSARFGKRPIVLVAFAVLSLIFVTIYFLGRLPMTPKMQIGVLVVSASFPLAALGILPNAILADIAQREAEETGENREGMFFAVKYLFVKLGQTIGIGVFAMLTVYGKDPGNDFGLRLNGILGFVLCVVALLCFSRFKERN